MKPENMKNEAHVKEAVKALCRKHGAYFYMPVPTGYGRMGVPDFLICHRGRFIAVETKFGGRKPTALQEKEIDAIVAAKGDAIVVNQWELEGLDDLLRNA